jgi:hypothetical protein
LKSFEVVSKYLGKDIFRTLTKEIEVLESQPSSLDKIKWVFKKGPLVLGRLAFKQEAAGKVRVFAIADA